MSLSTAAKAAVQSASNEALTRAVTIGLGASVTEIERQRKEEQLLQDDTDVRKIILDAISEGIPGINITNSIISGDVMRTIQGASQVTVTVHDLDRRVLRSGILQDEDGDLRTVDVYLDGLWFRLVKLSKQVNDLVLTFEDRDVSYLRNKKGPRKLGNRKNLTRAEAVLQLIRSVKQSKIPVKIHELHETQPTAHYSPSELEDAKKKNRSHYKAKKEEEDRDSNRAPGFPSDARVEGVTDKMFDVIAECLTVGESIKGFNERVALVMLVAGFQESNFDPSQVDYATGTHKGVFQSYLIPQYNTKEQAKYFCIGGRSFRDGAIKTVREHPTWTVGQCAAYVEVSESGIPPSGVNYQRHFTKARAVLNAWGGVDSKGNKVTYHRKRYFFRVEKKETYWDAIQRLATEVNWRAFMTGGVFHYISEEDMFKSRPRFILTESADGVDNIDFDWDRRKKTLKATASVRINRWAIPPGITVKINELGAASGKWLVESTTRQLFSAEATVALKKPLPEKREPINQKVRDRKKPEDDDSTGGGPVRASGGVAPPLKTILAHSNGYSGYHDGVDLICPPNALIYAICDAEVIDVRSGGWWNKNPSGNVSLGDGIIQLKCLVDNGPFKKGMHFGYGHAEKALVDVGDQVPAGMAIGHAGYAVAWHVHFMANGGGSISGRGDRDPWPYVAYAQRARAPRQTGPRVNDHPMAMSSSLNSRNAGKKPAQNRSRLGWPLSIRGVYNGGVVAHNLPSHKRGNWPSDNAVDINCALGTFVFAVDSGKVLDRGGSYSGGGSATDGYWIKIKTDDNEWYYTHLRAMRSDLRKGDRINMGEYIGESGAGAGVAHLHIACRNGNPETLLGTAGMPGT